MALINLGTSPDTATGDTLYGAFTAINTIIGNGNGDIESCTATGKGAMSAINTGISNTANGFYALSANTSGYSNTAIGVSALQFNTTGYYNTAIGIGALNKLTTANANTAIGSFSMSQFNTGIQNTAVGFASLEYNTSGVNNTAVGFGALDANTTGTNNVGLGIGALGQNQTKSYNTAIGTNALYFNNSLYTNCTGLGYNSNVSSDNQIRLGDTSITAVVSQVGSFSDIRDKADVRDTVLGLDFVNSLRPVDYKWDYREDYRTEMPTPLELDATEEEKDAHKIIMDEWLESCKLSNLVKDGSKKRTRYHHGLIAQEVQDLIEESGVDFGGFQDHTVGGGDDVMTVSYMELIAPMIKAIQELTARINVLEGN